jgi:hypothetical protein
VIGICTPQVQQVYANMKDNAKDIVSAIESKAKSTLNSPQAKQAYDNIKDSAESVRVLVEQGAKELAVIIIGGNVYDLLSPS